MLKRYTINFFIKKKRFILYVNKKVIFLGKKLLIKMIKTLKSKYRYFL